MTLLVCGCEDPSLVQVALRIHLEMARDTYQPFDDVKDLVDAVNQARIPVALVTNGASDTQREKVDALGMACWLCTFSVSGETGVAKPDKGAFTFALEALGVSGKEVWHVGDNLATDSVWGDTKGTRSST